MCYKITERVISLSFINGTHITDTEGNAIHAHGGYILKVGEFYYWYGEDRRDGTYVSCYRSSDLKSWENRGAILTVNSKCEKLPHTESAEITLNGKKINIERPKVIYSEFLKKFVMWAHYENGINYDCAAIVLATSDTPDGEFTYHGHFNPFGEMSRDCTLFTDGGETYFISAGNNNADLHIYSLTEDKLNVKKLEKKLFIGKYREAPALLRHNGKIFMLSSQCTGWRPNQCGYAYSDSVTGEWSELFQIGDETTYRSQPSFILPINSDGNTQYVYFGDRWGGSEWKDLTNNDEFDYFNSSYYISLIEIDGTDLKLKKCDEYELSASDGFKFIK